MSDQEEVVIVHRSPTKRSGYAQVPHAVTTDPRLSDGAVRLYALLHSYAFQADSFRCSQQKMGTDISKDARTIRRLLKELHDRGLVTPVRTGNRQVNAYILEDAYALYDNERPQPRKRVRSEIRPDKNDLSPDRTKLTAQGGQICPVVEDKNVLLLKNSSKKEEKKGVSPAAVGEKTPEKIAADKRGAAQCLAELRAAAARSKRA